MVYHNFLHLLHVFLWKIIIRLIKGDTNNVGKTKDSPGLGLRALQAMSSASITIMWLCEYDSKKTIIIIKWKLIYILTIKDNFQAYRQDVWKNYLATTSTGVLVAATGFSYVCFLQTLFDSPNKYWGEGAILNCGTEGKGITKWLFFGTTFLQKWNSLTWPQLFKKWINPLSPKSDQHQISLCNINAL